MKKVLLPLLVSSVGLFGQIPETRNQHDGDFLFNFEKFDSQFTRQRLSSKKMTGSITIPIPGEKPVRFLLNENNLTTQRIKEINTFNGVSEDGKSSIKLTLTGESFTAMIKTGQGRYFVVEKSKTSKDSYIIYSLEEPSHESSFICGAEAEKLISTEALKNLSSATSKSVTNFPIGSQLRSYRMAVAASAESTVALGNTDTVLADIISKVNAINLIYESEVSVTFTLIAETINKSLIFTDPATDPFTSTGAGASQTGFNTMNSSGFLAYDKYDIGHTVNISNTQGASGTAGGTPCTNTSKASGWSNWGYQNSLGFVANLIAHEMGHQFGASHTFNATGGDSPGDTFCQTSWSGAGAVEPGSGATLMSYSTNCGYPTDQRYTSDTYLSYFHAKSLDQILNKIQTVSNCYTVIASTNTPPVANAGVDITIPKNTPFRLIGTGSDADNTNLSYTWEQNDIATANDKGAFGSTLTGDGGFTAVNSTTAPLFRTVKNNVNGERYFPKLEFVLNNANIPPMRSGEALSNVARTINLRLTVRDNNTSNGGVDSDDLIVTVADSGPLAVTYPSASGITVNAGNTVAVTWDVNNTNTLKNTVDILLSTDGGLTFPLQLASNVLNNGSANIIIPNVPSTTTARIKVLAVLNSNAEFFDVSDNNFAINSTCAAYQSYAYPTAAVTVASGSSQANLNMTAPQAVEAEVSSYQNTYNTANLTSNNFTAYQDSSQTTPVFVNVRNGMVKKFKVTVSGNYSLNKTAGYMNMTVSSGTPFTVANFVTSNAIASGTVYGNTESAYFTAGTDYYLFLANASNGASHTITLNGPGKMLTETTPTAGYSYTFAAVGSNGIIAAISPTADFTTLPVGSYTVQGFSYLSSINPTTFVNNSFSSVITAGNCINLSKTNRNLTVTATLSTSEPAIDEGGIKLAPNPVSDYLTVISKKNITHYSVYDMSGRIIVQKEKFSNKLNFSNYSSGAYKLSLFDRDKMIYQATIINK